jgi:tripartite-type tricarboxylate transporter receptor subunit TctC
MIMISSRPKQGLLTTIAAVLALGAAASAQAGAEEFYSGKTIEILVGSAAGGGFDIYSRALARYWGRFIPGRPSVVVRNMPGAGGARSAAHVSTMAAKDGTVLAAPMPGAIVGPLLEDSSQAGFDPAKLQYLGTADSGVRVCVTMDKSRVKTFADALATKAIMGATQPGGSSTDYCLSAPSHLGRQVRRRAGLSGNERYEPRDGAR